MALWEKYGLDFVKTQPKKLLRKMRHLINFAGFDISRADNGKPRWSGIVEDYYPIHVRPRWGYGRGSHKTMERLLASEMKSFSSLLNDFQKYKNIFASISYEQSSPSLPHWNNVWFSTLDAASLMYFALSRTPRTYLEIGSGYSTKFIKYAITSTALSTRVISIDPRPRSEIDILCDEVIRSPLENLELSIFNRLEAGDICFFDGSHRVFTNSDTTVFFIDVLPRLKKGVLVHIHDIFWPDDYTPEWNGRLYSEQYLLGAMLLSGSARFRVVLPNYFVSKNTITASIITMLGIPITYPGTTMPGVSFWFEIL
jgi:predicted O-methyltransferase YrrM